MAKLEFVYGSMNSGKSLLLITKHHMLSSRGFEVQAFKPSLDTRSRMIETRLGVEIPCKTVDINQKISDYILEPNQKRPNYILCDEAQFLTKNQVHDLEFLVDNWGIDVICYGLKLNWKGDFFEGSGELMKHANVLTPIENFCKIEKGADAFFHIKHGPITACEIDVGFEEKYSSVSRKTWREWYDNCYKPEGSEIP